MLFISCVSRMNRTTSWMPSSCFWKSWIQRGYKSSIRPLGTNYRPCRRSCMRSDNKPQAVKLFWELVSPALFECCPCCWAMSGYAVMHGKKWHLSPCASHVRALLTMRFHLSSQLTFVSAASTQCFTKVLCPEGKQELWKVIFTWKGC